MERERRARLADLMAAMAEGDDAMIVAFMVEFGPELETAARFHARSLSVPVTDSDVLSLVAEFAMAIGDAARSWKPSGSLPWTYAKARLRQITIDLLIAPPAIDLGFDGDDTAGEGSRVLGVASMNDDGECFGRLAAMASDRPQLQEIVDRLAGANGRHVEIALTYRMQQLQGDEHASESVAEWFETSKDNVRKIAERVFGLLDDLDLDAMMVR